MARSGSRPSPAQGTEWVDAQDEATPALPLVWMEDGAEKPFDANQPPTGPWLEVVGEQVERESTTWGQGSRKPPEPTDEERKMGNDLLTWV